MQASPPKRAHRDSRIFHGKLTALLPDRGEFALIFTAVEHHIFVQSRCSIRVGRGLIPMRGQTSAGKRIANANRKERVAISPWVNERFPPLNELLRSQDVARLTRRPRWLIAGLCLIGRFPKRLNFHGHAIGWRRSEVLDWMGRDFVIEQTGGTTATSKLNRLAKQASLPFDNSDPCPSARAPCGRRTDTCCKHSQRAKRTASR